MFESISLFKWMFAVGITAGLLALFAWAVQRYGPQAAGRMKYGAFGAKGKRRLKLLETLPLDARRRVCLVRMDDMEHLILLGVTTETQLYAAHADESTAAVSTGEGAQNSEAAPACKLPIGFLKKMDCPAPKADHQKPEKQKPESPKKKGGKKK